MDMHVSSHLFFSQTSKTSATQIVKHKLWDNYIQNFHLGRYIVGYTVGNLVLRRGVSGAVKRDFRTYIRWYTSPNENYEYGYPNSNTLLTFYLQKDSKNFFGSPVRPADASCIKPLASCIFSLVNHEKRRYIMTSGSRQYIAGYTVANLWRYPIRRRVAYACAFECPFYFYNRTKCKYSVFNVNPHCCTLLCHSLYLVCFLALICPPESV